ncbi:uncharacterized protein N0V89_002889 [Didymosphaeria variabile]|uniref:Uncharacterized protein n=1 Tax=Didymosphaeria variabile TaxID=1932322 RepID=A0A9W8XVM6_9PLEO|nr:uncharacterized protein N0V89_002889 [Didymosphaeria variabile]KAJ4358307.1 hypothetical protein N0V89_002889 [Didymosphaeria variabile]
MNLMRLRSRFRWFLRETRSKSNSEDVDNLEENRRKKDRKAPVPTGDKLIDQLAAAILQEAGSSEEEESEEEHNEGEEHENEGPSVQSNPVPPSENLDPAEALRRQLRQQQLQAESDEKWSARKRRRRTRGWAGLPADAPGEPPRFPSETTLDESKAYLGLDNQLYAQIRDEFQAICRTEGILRKTVAGPDKWAELLQRLVRGNHHLTVVFQQQAETLQQVNSLWKPKNYQTRSLDIICQDVTKRMRVMETRMSISEAKNMLKLNPSQTRDAKHAFLKILKADHFTNKFEAGGQHWSELKQRWVDGSELLKNAITPSVGDGDDKCAQRLRAMEVLARDVMKRLRAEGTQIRKEQSGDNRKTSHHGPGPGPAPPSAPSQNRTTHSTVVGKNRTDELVSAVPHMREAREDCTSGPQTAQDADLQIDPSLLLAASDAILPSAIALQHPCQHSSQQLELDGTHSHAPNAHGSFATQPHTFLPPSIPSPLPIYFRLHSRSATPFPHKTVWLSVLQAPLLEDVRKLATREHPGSEVVHLEGVIGTRDGEMCVGIDDDAELGAYLGHVGARTGGGRGKVTFVVRLRMSGSGGGWISSGQYAKEIPENW